MGKPTPRPTAEMLRAIIAQAHARKEAAKQKKDYDAVAALLVEAERAMDALSLLLCTTCGKNLDREGRFCVACWKRKHDAPPPNPMKATEQRCVRFVAGESQSGKTKVKDPRRVRTALPISLYWADGQSPSWDDAVKAYEDHGG